MGKRSIDDYKDRMTSPIGITVTTKKPAEEIGLTFIEPDDYFTEDMLKVLEEGERAHNSDKKRKRGKMAGLSGSSFRQG